MLNRRLSRRRFLEVSGAAALSSAVVSADAVSAVLPRPGSAAGLERALERVLGGHARQFQVRLRKAEKEGFRLSGSAGNVVVEGSTASAVMMGVNWYLRTVAGVSVSWNGDCLNRLAAKLPAPSGGIERTASVPHRFALNDTNDGYTGPYWPWERWERLIDVLALHGINEVLVTMGAEAVYQQTFRHFGYTDEEMRRWLPTPAHQPWWLLENLSGWVGPAVPQPLIDARVRLGARITGRLRELGMTPVLPGYYGMVPDGFAVKHPEARVIAQGEWLGMKRPDWLDPTGGMFGAVAAEFYRVQEQLLGPSTMFKMDPLHEGGRADGVDIGRAAGRIEAELERAHPGATWAILGWQKNPKPELVAGLANKDRALILDGQADRFAYEDRETQWGGTPYAFGSIWNFGGHTTMGANTEVWAERFFDQREKAGSRLRGIAVMPEASCNNPAAFALLTELPWRAERPKLTEWFRQWAGYRYGGVDENAERAWDVLRRTAYAEAPGQWSESHDNLFSAQPSLTAKSACSFSPKTPRYDMAVFASAIGALLQVGPALRGSSAYRYDLVDVARQTIANTSRTLLPRIQQAFAARDAKQFQKLTHEWLARMDWLNRVAGTQPDLLVGAWLDGAKQAARTPGEERQLEFDARSLLVEWGPRASEASGVHDYANREWNGLLEFYRERWALYFSSLAEALEKQEEPKAIDWFGVDEEWAKRTNRYASTPRGEAYEVVREAMRALALESS